MKEKLKNYWVTFAAALVVILTVSAIAGYRSGMKDKQIPVQAEVKETKETKNKMTWPVEGEILKGFSMDTSIYFETLDQYKCNPGILIKADVGKEIVASVRGTVEAIKEDAVYGNCVTMDLGNGYKMLYGQLDQISVKEGDSLTEGQKIAVVAEPTKYFTEEGSHLYLSLTKDGVPVDPKEILGS